MRYSKNRFKEKLWYIGWGVVCIAAPFLIAAAIFGGLPGVLIALGIGVSGAMIIAGIVMLIHSTDL